MGDLTGDPERLQVLCGVVELLIAVPGLVSIVTTQTDRRTLPANRLILSRDINQRMAASIHLIKALRGGWGAETFAPQPIDAPQVQM